MRPICKEESWLVTVGWWYTAAMTFVNDLSPILADFGALEIRWYGLMYAIGLVLAYGFTFWVFKREKYSTADLDSLAIYLFIGMVVGARLGHVFFYSADYFLNHPLEILMIWKGGLASHGGAIGVFLAYLIWTKVHKVKFVKYPDALVLGFPILAGFIRLGNFFNSEIYGVPTDGSFGVIFKRLGEDFPRHPVQLYETLASWLIFIILLAVYKRAYKKTPPLFFMFLYMLLYFSWRFFVEFWKDLHGPLTQLPITMGQLLSIAPILIALVYFIFYFPKSKKMRE